MRITIFAGLLSVAGSLLGQAAIADETMKAKTGSAAPVTSLTVDLDKPGAKVSPQLYGVFFEDINFAADGGLYAELVKNRSFEFPKPLVGWSALGTAGSLTALTEEPFAATNPHYLRIQADTAGYGAVNEGFRGIGVRQGAAYNFSAQIRGEGTMRVELVAADGRVLASAKLSGMTKAWKTFTATLCPTATEAKARLSLVAEASGVLDLDMVSLFPQDTFKNRPNGMRADLAQILADLKPGFVRFPGGCIVEGQTLPLRYQWKTTIGKLEDRKLLFNRWNNTRQPFAPDYFQSFGLGFFEYFQFCEDIGAEPLPIINCGMACQYNSGELVPLDQLGPYIQDALDLIEFANGPATSTWGAKRAEMGHPEPFNLKYLGIGNEQWGNAYFDRYDKYDRNGPKVFAGEYAAHGKGQRNNWESALAEAAFMTGLERNSDVVAMSAYAPLLAHVEGWQWKPDLIWFDNLSVVATPNYHVQKLFSNNRGDVILPVKLNAPAAVVSGGAIGLGTWQTQAEYKDIKVTQGGKVLFASDFAGGIKGWRIHGGNWQAKDGALQQTGAGDNIRAFVGDKSWNNYTLTLKARKLGGSEGFLVAFRVGDENAKAWWNIGGWGNKEHGIEMEGVAASRVPGMIENGKWYDIRVELNGANIKCFLDGKLIHDTVVAAKSSILYASATRSQDEIILKVVNAAAAPVETDVNLAGSAKLAEQTQVTVLASDDLAVENTLENPQKLVPVTTALKVAGPTFRHTFPGMSVTVLRLKVLPPAPVASTERWSAEKAWDWYKKQPWLVGFNFVPSTACNTTEWWQAETFDPVTIDRELGMAKGLGFNTTRAFIQYIVWKQDPEGFMKRFEQFLALADKHGITVMPVLFDDCAFGEPQQFDPFLGKQREPIPGMIMPSWTPCPGIKLAKDPAERPMLKKYVQDMLTTYGKDKRVIVWDLYNEPMNVVKAATPAMLEEIFTWARAVNPDQPLTIAEYNENEAVLNRAMHARSDVISFHRYANIAVMQNRIATFKRHGRPVLCTEWMARPFGGKWATDLPQFKQEGVACYNWGLVNGRTQCHFLWDSKRGTPEPEIWYHDLFHKDGKPYDPAEHEVIRKMTADKTLDWTAIGKKTK